MLTRRDFLKLAAMLSGKSAISGFIPESIQPAYTIQPELGSRFLDAEHIVMLMRESRSFDHAFGALSGVRASTKRILGSGKDWLQSQLGAAPVGLRQQVEIFSRTAMISDDDLEFQRRPWGDKTIPFSALRGI